MYLAWVLKSDEKNVFSNTYNRKNKSIRLLTHPFFYSNSSTLKKKRGYVPAYPDKSQCTTFILAGNQYRKNAKTSD